MDLPEMFGEEMKQQAYKVLAYLEYLWITVAIPTVAIISAFLFMEMMQFMRTESMEEWVIQITGIMLTISTIGLLIKLTVIKVRYKSKNKGDK